jgi:Icc-related predicted phosphoesterase
MMHIKERMSDYHHIKNSGVNFYRFLPEHAVSEYHAMVKFVTDTVDQRRAAGNHSRQVVVVGHHAPSRQSTHPRYRDDHYLNGAYSSNLDDFILDRPEIALWTHGHTHEDFDYMIGNTRVVCNPRGYHGYEPRTDTWQPKLVEL